MTPGERAIHNYRVMADRLYAEARTDHASGRPITAAVKRNYARIALNAARQEAVNRAPAETTR